MSAYGCIFVGGDFNVDWNPRDDVAAVFVYVTKHCEVADQTILRHNDLPSNFHNMAGDPPGIHRRDLDYYFVVGVVYGTYTEKLRVYKALPFEFAKLSYLMNNRESVTAFIMSQNMQKKSRRDQILYKAETPDWYVKGRGNPIPGNPVWGLYSMYIIGNNIQTRIAISVCLQIVVK